MIEKEQERGGSEGKADSLQSRDSDMGLKDYDLSRRQLPSQMSHPGNLGPLYLITLLSRRMGVSYLNICVA